jgi:HlyD family secretion protein
MTPFKTLWYEIIARLDRLTAPAAGRWLPQKKSSRMYVLFGSIFFVVIAITMLVGDPASDQNNPLMGTFTVRQGDLTISVTESGSIKARKAVDIKSEVEGQATIISVVPDGTYIKPEDVNNKILVELDSSDLREKLTQQEITFANSKASYTDANEAFLIQKKENESNVSQGQLNLQFALIDLQKYLGEAVAGKLLDSTQSTADPNYDIAAMANDPNLGGDALQKLRELKSSIDLAEAELKRCQSKLGWTQKLFEKKYVAGDELEADRLDENRRNVELDKDKTAMELFRRYEFPKQARKLFSDYIEAGRKLERIEAQARSKLAQSEARLASAQATYDLQNERLAKLKKQLVACVIKAPASGLVVYETSTRMFGGTRNMIEAGASVHERQTIMSLPDTAEMAVEIKIHESSIDKVRPGLPARITVDSLPDTRFSGKVIKVAPLPDQANFFMNPDLKVYNAEVSIDGMSESLKPGKSAKVEIIIDQLTDVTHVPVQAVCNRGGKKVCYLAGTSPQPITVTTGLSNDNFVEITDGLSVGQTVLLNPPTIAEADHASDKGVNTPSRPDTAAKPKKPRTEKTVAVKDSKLAEK